DRHLRYRTAIRRRACSRTPRRRRSRRHGPRDRTRRGWAGRRRRAQEHPSRPPAGRAPAAGAERLPRSAGAAQRLLQPPAGLRRHGPLRWRRVPRHAGPSARGGEQGEEHADRRRRRPDRRLAPPVGRLPRRAGHRRPQPDRSGLRERRQPRVRRGARRAAAHPERRMPPRGRLCRPPAAVPGRGLPVPLGQRLRDRDPAAAAAALRHPQGAGRRGGLHRHDPRGHALRRDPLGCRRAAIRGRGGHRQPVRGGTAGPGCRGHRGPAARGRLPDRRHRCQRLHGHDRADH
ncbi:MAG: 5'-nucleotidase, partial [uncultured Nocardioidaceae bacterium]